MATAPATPTFRLNVLDNDALMAPAAPRRGLEPAGAPQSLPEPVYPRVAADRQLDDRQYHDLQRDRAIKAWAVPFFGSRWRPNTLRPIIAYLFTDYKCNLDCHYCWA